MKPLLVLAFFAMAFVHLGLYGELAYVPITACLLLLLILSKKLYLTDAAWYNAGALLIIAGTLIGSIAHGTAVSFAYVFFGLLNFFIYPLFQRRIITDGMLTIVFFCLLPTLIPLGMNAGKAVTIYGNANNYCAVTYCVLYFGMLRYRDNLRAQVPIFLLFLGLIYLGGSRSMLGATLLFGAAYLLQTRILHVQFRRIAFFGVVLMCIAYWSLVTTDRFGLMETIQEYTFTPKKERGLSHRDELVVVSLNIIADYPEGVGAKMSPIYVRQRYPESMTPHNTFLKILVEGGWVMLIGYLILIGGFFLTSTSPLATAFLLAMIIRGLFESSTPLALSLVSEMLVIPMFLHERTVSPERFKFAGIIW